MMLFEKTRNNLETQCMISLLCFLTVPGTVLKALFVFIPFTCHKILRDRKYFPFYFKEVEAERSDIILAKI
jgi:hypothetical protein